MGRLRQQTIDRIREMWREGYTSPEIADECSVSKPTALKYKGETEGSQGGVDELDRSPAGASDDIAELRGDVAKLIRRVNQLRTCLLSGNQANETYTYCPHCGHWAVLMMRGGKLTCPNCGRHVMPPLTAEREERDENE